MGSTPPFLQVTSILIIVRLFPLDKILLYGAVFFVFSQAEHPQIC